MFCRRFVADLEEARALARGNREATPFSMGSDTFHVAAAGMGRYPYRLEHVRGVVALTTSTNIPTVRVQPRAAFIHGVGLWAAVEWFASVVELALGAVQWKVSRVDLFMDSHGWELTAADRHRFVARSKQTVVYEDDAVFRTLQFGTAGSGVKARIYDKTEESAKKGSDWWPMVWGESYREGERVIRVEFETNRELLRQVKIDSLDDARDRLPDLWAYLTERWLSLRVPSADATRARWPVAAEWEQVQRASMRGDAVGLDRVSHGASAGSIRRLLPQLRGYLASAGAHLDAQSLDETLHRVGRLIVREEDDSGVPFASLLAAKRTELIA